MLVEKLVIPILMRAIKQPISIDNIVPIRSRLIVKIAVVSVLQIVFVRFLVLVSLKFDLRDQIIDHTRLGLWVQRNRCCLGASSCCSGHTS